MIKFSDVNVLIFIKFILFIIKDKNYISIYFVPPDSSHHTNGRQRQKKSLTPPANNMEQWPTMEDSRGIKKTQTSKKMKRITGKSRQAKPEEAAAIFNNGRSNNHDRKSQSRDKKDKKNKADKADKAENKMLQFQNSTQISRVINKFDTKEFLIFTYNESTTICVFSVAQEMVYKRDNVYISLTNLQTLSVSINSYMHLFSCSLITIWN